MASYDNAVTAKKKNGSVSGVPVAEMGDAYSRDTLALTDKILAYAAFPDPADPARIKVRWVGGWGRRGHVVGRGVCSGHSRRHLPPHACLHTAAAASHSSHLLPVPSHPPACSW